MLVIDNVTVRFGGVTALSDFSAQVPDGEICGFIGPNGAGKTTLFNCCTRMVRPAAGRISFDGHDLLAEPPHGVIRRGVARTFQNLAIFPTLTVLDNTMVGAHSRARVSFAQALVGWPASLRRQRRLRAEAFGILEQVGLADVAFERADSLPFGTQKRIEGNPVYAKDPGYRAYVTNAKKVDPKNAQPDNTYYETGWMIADMMVNDFQTAASSSLGLSQAGIMQAARNQDYQPPLFIDGIKWIMNANEAYGIMKLQPLLPR